MHRARVQRAGSTEQELRTEQQHSLLPAPTYKPLTHFSNRSALLLPSAPLSPFTLLSLSALAMFAPSAALLSCALVAPAASTLPSLPSLPSLPAPPSADSTGEYGKAPKLFTCTVCNITIKGRRGNLQRHMVDVHSDAKKKECGLCGKRMKHAALVQHAKQCGGVTVPPAAAPNAPPAAIATAPPAATKPESPLSPDTLAPERSAVLVKSTRIARPRTAPLATELIDAASEDFLKWLATPPVPTEHLLRKKATPAAIVQTRQSVRQLVRDIAEVQPNLFASGVHRACWWCRTW